MQDGEHLVQLTGNCSNVDAEHCFLPLFLLFGLGAGQRQTARGVRGNTGPYGGPFTYGPGPNISNGVGRVGPGPGGFAPSMRGPVYGPPMRSRRMY
ncbi:hypothetical protein LLE49_01315 [Alicyclobacillus tolerans]|uniref:hypothetical protein n=1 Tax=Alicyclobacillus tolerans TaxID=90970 RepID=UPI001F45F28E|nr:hypothetical protein [Alicyclobacillus tolerans]MCF8563383.1 hypothetical protein [Alicyclobacillus tolerans]